MKAKYRFVGKYLKMNAFLNNTKCTLAQVQPYNATFTVILLSWPKNLEYFFISHESIRWPFCHWSPFVVSRRPSWVWTSTWKLQVNCLKTPHLKKIEWHSYDNHKTFSQNFEIHGSYNKGSDLSQGHICRMMKMYVILENLFLKSHIWIREKLDKRSLVESWVLTLWHSHCGNIAKLY